MVCEFCNKEHDGKYATGRFCSSVCARKYSSNIFKTKKNSNISKAIKNKIDLGLKVGCVQKNNNNVIIALCEICNKKYETRIYDFRLLKKTCSKLCAKQLRIKSNIANNNKNTGGYRRGSGRGKSGWYRGYWCDSSYELAFVIYNIEHNIDFKRNEIGFEYIWNNKKYKYYPDFIMNGKFYEIKGYETNKDVVKYKSVGDDLIVLYKNDLNNILSYVKEKYGNDYIKLYDNNPNNLLNKKCKVCGCLCKHKNVYCSRKCAGRGNNRNSVWKK